MGKEGKSSRGNLAQILIKVLWIGYRRLRGSRGCEGEGGFFMWVKVVKLHRFLKLPLSSRKGQYLAIDSDGRCSVRWVCLVRVVYSDFNEVTHKSCCHVQGLPSS